MKLSIIIPIYNEEENIQLLNQKIEETFQEKDYEYEIIFVDDGSTDNSYEELKNLKNNKTNIKIIKFVRNYGQTPALAAGIANATGEIIIPLDADLQNDPADIPKMIELYKRGYDIVSGWRLDRKDDIIRTFFSQVANKIISYITKINIHDFGCSLKLYNAEKLKKVCLCGELHRFIPVLVKMYGAKITEVEVTHHPRLFGVSKYNLLRTTRVILDLITITLITQYKDKPMYFFGHNAIFSFVCFLIFLIYGLILNSTPAYIFSAAFLIIAVLLINFGLIAELLLRLRLEKSECTNYLIEEKIL